MTCLKGSCYSALYNRGYEGQTGGCTLMTAHSAQIEECLSIYMTVLKLWSLMHIYITLKTFSSYSQKTRCFLITKTSL